MAALEWVRDNFANFGADPGSVMLFGQSRGGSKAARMMHTLSAKGLFYKIVCGSGGGDVMAGEDVAKDIKTGRSIAADLSPVEVLCTSAGSVTVPKALVGAQLRRLEGVTGRRTDIRGM